MKNILVFSVCSLILLIHLCAAIYLKDPTWIDRSGAAVVVAGIILEGWNYLTTKDPDKMPQWNTLEGHSAIRAALLIIIVGTAIQAYGGPLFKMAAGN